EGAAVSLSSAAKSTPGREITEPLGRVDLGPDGGEFSDIQTAEPITDWSAVFRRFNLDPDAFSVVGDTVRMTSWEQSKRTENGDRDVVRLYSYRASFTRTRDAIDLPALYAAARSKPRGRVKTAPADRATVVVLADPQIGKTGRRGGTPELLDRMAEKRELLAPLLKTRKPSRILLADAGDGFEGFESGGNPMFTNDLSLSQQMDAFGTELYLFLELAHRFAPVDVAAVPSNHTAWRNGKQNLGNPQDDLGLFVHKQVAKVARASKMDATWHVPLPYDESVAVDLLGTVIGMVHGNQFGPGQSVQWWEKQTFGAQAVANADVLLSGHYHSFSANVAGRNPVNQRMRWSLSAPTIDNGSDYYRQTAGRDSDPGMLIFDVTPAGFDLGSLVIL
ncbi:MAG: hypothetical protein ACYC6C_14740, partial [Coriobacteriia bacterium]